jgi:hypothetical protein
MDKLKFSTLLEFELQPVYSRYTDYATAAQGNLDYTHSQQEAF